MRCLRDLLSVEKAVWLAAVFSVVAIPVQVDAASAAPAVRKMGLDEACRKIAALHASQPAKANRQDAVLTVSEYRIEDFWGVMGMQFFRLDRGAFASSNYLYADGKLTRVEIPTFGGAGLLGGVVYGKALYLTSEWGSGILRTALYRIARDESGKLETRVLGVISSIAGRFDKAFLEDETVRNVIPLLRPLTRGGVRQEIP